MLSEWLVEVPVDMAEKWLLILVPEVLRQHQIKNIFGSFNNILRFRDGEILLLQPMGQQKYLARAESKSRASPVICLVETEAKEAAKATNTRSWTASTVRATVCSTFWT